MQLDAMPASRPADAPKLNGLEVLRVLAAFGVLVWHYQHFLFVGDAAVGYDPTRAPFHTALAPFYDAGYYGVELFWCISGFIFTWKYGRAVRAGLVSFDRFLLLRFSRLYPLHLATLLLAAGLNAIYFARHGFFFVHQFNDLKHFLLNLVLASHWGLQDGYSFKGPTWSISIEVLLYLLFFALARGFGSRRLTDGMAAGVVLITVVALRKLYGTRIPVLDGAAFFYLGAVACHVEAALDRGPPMLRRLVAAGCFTTSAIAAALMQSGAIRAVWAMVILAPGLLLLFELAAQELPRTIEPWCRGLGNLTYASYILHFPLQICIVLSLESWGLAIRPLFYRDMSFLGYILLTFGLSQLAYRRFERPMQEMIRQGRLDMSGLLGVRRRRIPPVV